MAYLTQAILCALGTFFTYGLIKLYGIVHLRWTSPLLLLPGPKNESVFWGNLTEILKSDNNTEFHNVWFREHGMSLYYRDLLGIPVLCTKDNRAMAHILSHSDIYQKPGELRTVLARIFGEGLLVVEGAHHKQQRKIMNPAFGATQIRALTNVFTEKALMLRDRWSSEMSTDPKGTRIDVLKWLNLTTLDVIGQAGFNYQFDALDPASPLNELNEAFKNLFNATQHFSILFLLQEYIPILRIIPTVAEKQIKFAQKTMASVGAKLLEDAKVNAAADKDNTQVDRDLLTLLVKANMAVQGGGGQKLSDVDVLAQVPTFLVAGHETTSSATTWALFALAKLPSAQSRLRDECLDLATDSPTMDELNSLAYLDCVVKEVMRVHAPVPSTNRAAVQDDVIPLDEPWVDEQGVKHYSIKIAKGDSVSILIGCMNQSEEVWGPDAATFRPERWESAETLAPNGIPGVCGNQLTFLAGPRSCIGYRFALAEMKAILYTLVRAFEFDLAVPAEDIIFKQSIVSRPIVTSERDAGNQMPLLVKAYRG
ncbi:cytochrome P450 [Athelia psychrophila]|uniref:Cytochrome P450 n=1 Tax=Athelia psychrophila TaxID=1759441 RepID=A0A166QYR1_9AGAM|nr:cytochrome P450 [Fibularhizoctonia sp. CBS 109695]